MQSAVEQQRDEAAIAEQEGMTKVVVSSESAEVERSCSVASEIADEGSGAKTEQNVKTVETMDTWDVVDAVPRKGGPKAAKSQATSIRWWCGRGTAVHRMELENG